MVVVGALTCALALAGAAEPPGAEASTVELAEHLEAIGLHRQAFAEWMRAARQMPESHQHPLRAGVALWNGGEWSLAVAHFRRVPGTDGRLGAAYSLYRGGQLLPAISLLGDLAGPESRYLEGWAHLRLRDTASAVASWQAVGPGSRLTADAIALVADVTSAGPVPHRTPPVAGVLSAVLPGLGQAYVGRWGEAVSALVVNGLLVAAAWQLAERRQWFGFGLVVLVESGFYGGNVLSAINGARRFNRRAWRDHLAPLSARELVLEPVDGAFIGRASR